MTFTISVQILQFAIVVNIFERDWSNFNQENFILDYFFIDKNVAFKADEQNLGYSNLIFFSKKTNNLLLSNYTPFEKTC